jgi:hypothetical protein
MSAPGPVGVTLDLARRGFEVVALDIAAFDAEHDAPPPPDTREILGVRYASQLLAVVDEGACAAILRRREIIGSQQRYQASEVVVRLDRVSADEVLEEAVHVGFLAEPHISVPETEHYIGATAAVLRAPRTGFAAKVGTGKERRTPQSSADRSAAASAMTEGR